MDAPGARRGKFYRQTLPASGGTGAFTWSVSSGALPLGLRLDADTGEIYGKVATRGTWNFTVTAIDSQNQTATQSLTINVRLY